MSDSHHKIPKVVRPPSKCAVTIKGFSSKVTVKAPSAPCRHTRTNNSATALSGWPRVLRFHSAQPSSPTMMSPERAREITMDHFVNGFGEVVVCLRIDVPVTSRPVRTAQARIGQTHPGAQHDDRRGERGAGKRKSAKPNQASLAVHG